MNMCWQRLSLARIAQLLGTKTFSIIALLCCFIASTSVQAGLVFVKDSSGQKSTSKRDLIQWTHSRLVFDRDLERVAVGQEKTLEVEILNGKELLLLAKNVGRTSLIVWYVDGSSDTYLFSVTEDLSVLRLALKDIHPELRLDVAPDRDALVLRGKVPTLDYKIAAEAAARHYLGASQQGNQGQSINDPNKALADAMQMVVASQGNAATNNFRLNRPAFGSNSRVAVINLIKVNTLPKSMEQKILDVISSIGGEDVKVKRILRGDIANDDIDTLMLEGEVRDQVTLTRVLSIASRLFVGQSDAQGELMDMTAITDESGGLIGQRGEAKSSGGLGGSLSGSLNNSLEDNDIRSNVARAKLLSIAGGRLLSVIKVRDLPQIRVSVQIHEVNRNRMHEWRPDFSLVTSGYNDAGLFPLGGLNQVRPSSNSVENALQVIGGTLTNNLQVGGSDLAFDLLFSLMEEEGISKTLSRPTLLVLAGESAVFTVGGEVPVPTAFAPTGVSADDDLGNSTSGVFSGTVFKSFGVELKVRAMVDENDRITLDVNPVVSTPDALLTESISGSTGSSLNTTAFNTRSISTTTRLQDGQPLVLGGMVYNQQSSTETFTPGVNKVPGFGALVEATSSSSQDRELVIVVTPTLVREPIAEVHQWAFPSTLDLVMQATQPAFKRPSQNEDK